MNIFQIHFHIYLFNYNFLFHNGDLYNIIFDNFGRQLYENN